jgi:hypothetical protein
MNIHIGPACIHRLEQWVARRSRDRQVTKARRASTGEPEAESEHINAPRYPAAHRPGPR